LTAKVITKRLKVIISARTLVEVIRSTCDSSIYCLLRSSSTSEKVAALISAQNLTPFELMHRNTNAYLVPLKQLTSPTSIVHASVIEQMSCMERLNFQDMMNIGATHLPVSVESVNSLSVSSRTLSWREPYVSDSGMREINLQLRKRFLAATSLKVIVRVHGGEDWPTEVYRCEPSLKDEIGQHPDVLRFVN